MKILFVVPYVPSLIRVRPYNLLRSLAGQGHQITMATLWTDEQEQEELQALQPYCTEIIAQKMPKWKSLLNCVAVLPTRTPLQSVYSWQPSLANALLEKVQLAQETTPFDVIHVEHLRGARYGMFLKQKLAGRSALPIVWDSVDSISLLFRHAVKRSKSLVNRSITRLELSRTEQFEGWLVDQFDRVVVTSKVDCEALENLPRPAAGGKARQISILRNGVDLGYFAPDAGRARAGETVVISGKMSYHANVAMALHFVQNIMPLVWAARPEVKVNIVGKDPTNQVLELGKDPRVTVTGMVPDIRPFLQEATLAAAPIAYGVGIQNKVLEAMACGTPVVTTPQAISALDLEPGKDVLVAGQPQQFAGAILQLLAAPGERARLGEAGRCYVEKHHHWGTITEQLQNVYSSAKQSRQTNDA